MSNGPAPLGALSMVLAAALVATTAPALANSHDYSWSGDVAAGTQLSISDVNGKIDATRASGRTLEVKAHIASTDGSDVKDINVVMKRSTGRIAFCVVRPGDVVDDNCSRTSSNDWKSHETVDFTVRVPDGVPFDAKTVNGAISATGLTAGINAKTVNGRIAISTTGSAEAKVVNGSIDARMGAANWKGALSFKTVNGSVSLHLPKGAGFALDAKTLNGSIDAGAFGLHETGRHFVGHTLQGRVGAGGGDLNVKTVNGSVRIEAS